MLAAAMLLVLPGKTFSLVSVNDVFIFFDGAHRVLNGQLPNRDFHTPLGLLAYMLPALGLWVSGTLGGMMPVATAAFALLFLPLLIHVCVSRLTLGYAALFASFAIMLVLTPTNIGDFALTFAMFYNRWGYALLGILFLLVLPPVRGARGWRDAGVAAAVLLLTFYLKISYFGIAAVFVVALVAARDTRRTALLALVAAGVGIALTHLVWGGTAGYLADIGMAAEASGVIRDSVFGLAGVGFINAGMAVPFAFAMLIGLRRGVSYWTLLLCLFMAGAGLALANQNAQGLGLLTLIPAAIVVALSPAVRPPHDAAFAWGPAAFLLAAALAVPHIGITAGGLVRHAVMASATDAPRDEYFAEIDGVFTQEGTRSEPGTVQFDSLRAAYRSGAVDMDTLGFARRRKFRQFLAQPEYMWTLQDAVRLVRANPRLRGPIFTLDMANPLNAMLGRPAPRGVDSWYHVGRTISPTMFRDAASVLAEADVVMAPKAPVEPFSTLLMEELYGDYVRRNYELVAVSDYWRVYARRTAVRP